MTKLFRNVRTVLLLISFLFIACGSQEQLIPLYQQKNIVSDLENIKFHIEAKIPPAKIEPSTFRQITRSLIGWIPGYGMLVEMPLNFLGAVMPALPSISHPNLPANAQLSDPKVLAALNAVRIKEGSIRIIPLEERKDFECKVWYRFWDGFKCPEVKMSDFLSSIDIYLTFIEPKPDYVNSTDGMEVEQKKEILLAWTSIKENFDESTQTLTFNTAYNVNLKDYLERYGNFDIRVEARGWYPKFDTQIDGKVKLELELKLSDKPKKDELNLVEYPQ